jgi:DNA-binding NarL/FixJ family response regulator
MIAARESVRRAVIAREPAAAGRSSARGSTLWPALIAGHWRLLDVFAAAGVRYLVAYQDTCSAALRALSSREQFVLENALAGHAGKWIASESGLSESSVTRTQQAALRTIGAPSIAALAGVRTARFEPFDDPSTQPTLAVARLAPVVLRDTRLTDSEQDVVSGVWGGKAVAMIARERGTSPRTVKNQILQVYRKLAISSRRELLAFLVDPEIQR